MIDVWALGAMGLEARVLGPGNVNERWGTENSNKTKVWWVLELEGLRDGL